MKLTANKSPMRNKLLLLIGLCFTAFDAANSQNIGINTDGTAPETDVLLDLKGDEAKATTGTSNLLQLKSSDADNNAFKLRLGLRTHATAGSRYSLIQSVDFATGTPTYRSLSLNPDGGNVGIGIEVPSDLLHVDGIIRIPGSESNDYQIRAGQNTSTGIVVRAISNPANANTIFGVESSGTATRFGVTQGFGSWARDGFWVGTYDNGELTRHVGLNRTGGHMLLLAGEVERMRVEDDGNVGIGVNAPSVLLDVKDNNAIRLGDAYISSGTESLGASIAHFANNAWYNGAAWQFPDANVHGALIQLVTDDINFHEHDGDNNFSLNMVIKGGGNVGIGVDPTQKLDVNGQIRIRGGAPGAGKVLTSTADGTATWEDAPGGGGNVSGNYLLVSGSSNVTVPNDTYYIEITSTSNITITFPNPNIGAGTMIVIRNNFGSGTKTIRGPGSNQMQRAGISGSDTSYTITVPGGGGNYTNIRGGLIFMSNGSVWSEITQN
jgi:hypothetical protein